MTISLFESFASRFYSKPTNKRVDNHELHSPLTRVRNMTILQGAQDDGVLVDQCLSGVCEIRLNRPSALNALSTDMCASIIEYLKSCESRNSVKMILIKGTGKAFCAGGDIKAVSNLSRSGQFEKGAMFFDMNFSMEHLIGNLKTPTITIMDGITMGGGVGLCINAPFRIATENTLFAMPENAVGLFSDASASFWMPRLDGYFGHYLALTGRHLRGTDVFYIGIATHYIPAKRLSALETELARLSSKSMGKASLDAINNVIEGFAVDMELENPFSLDSSIRDAINRCFRYSTIEEIVTALQNETIAINWAKESLEQLSNMSPTSLKISLELFQQSEHLSFTECMKLEYQLAVKVLSERDFIEGTTAVLMTRTKANWVPSTLQQVDLSKIKQYYFDSSANSTLSLLCEGGNYVDNPQCRFALPTCTDILKVHELVGRESTVQYFLYKHKGKQGVKAKINEVLNVCY
ncbi:ClpP/crotonase-like domain-containing protein [Fennellomyces sp. T-0311]|nr:ClpP/crotonase-like domain-containing protein [Fennellomyces sp. T-0311]